MLFDAAVSIQIAMAKF